MAKRTYTFSAGFYKPWDEEYDPGMQRLQELPVQKPYEYEERPNVEQISTSN